MQFFDEPKSFLESNPSDQISLTGVICLVQNEADFVITYHSSLSDAQSGLNDLATNFTSVSNQQIIYGRIENKLSSIFGVGISANCGIIFIVKAFGKTAPCLIPFFI